MDAKEFKALLIDLRACSSAIQWAKRKSLSKAWQSCKRGDWLLWLAGKMADKPGWPTRKQMVLGACACAETALKYVKPGEDRPRLAIETTRAWVRGEASIDDVRIAASAAYAAHFAAYAAAYSAYSAAYAADAAYAAYAAAYAAYAAAAGADAAYAAYASFSQARSAERAWQSDRLLTLLAAAKQG